jgi:DNA-binding response OmpR family regulator
MKKILVIDDDAAVRDTIVQILESEGYRVDSAGDGRRGLALFHSGRPDLTITDIIMPQMEGIEMITEIRKASPEAKVIAISGGSRIISTDFLEIARLLGAADVIAKPFDTDDFLARVGNCLAG